MLTVWRFCDGKPGHDRQTRGLVAAFARRTDVQEHRIDVGDGGFSLWATVCQRLGAVAALPDPDILLGAGRRCEWPLLASRYVRGGRAVYLMKPQLPLRCFDLCLVPHHDKSRHSAKILRTDGVLNDIVSTTARGDEGLILIGGPSKHFRWNNAQLLAQIRAIVHADPPSRWWIATSRRTPRDTVDALRREATDRITIMDSAQAPPNWLRERYASCHPIWVSRDSVSMLFEALSSGAAVGVIEVTPRNADRITTIASDLCRRQLATSFADWRSERQLRVSAPLDEATRAATAIMSAWGLQ